MKTILEQFEKGQLVGQQGDVLIKRVDKLPENAIKLKTKILQESEITGHHHHFKEDAPVTVYQLSETALTSEGITTITPNLGKFITVEEDTFLYHGKEFDYDPAPLGKGDHKALKIEPGTYYIDIVKEFDYDTNEAVRVVD